MRSCVISLTVALAACATEYPPVPESCVIGEHVSRLRFTPLVVIDVIIAIDTSPSMADEAARVDAELAAIMDLGATFDWDGDGTEDFGPADVRFHVVEAEGELLEAALSVPAAHTPSGEPNGLSIIVITDSDDVIMPPVRDVVSRILALRDHPADITFSVIGDVTPCTGIAEPTRLLSVARALDELGATTQVESLCDDDWRGVLEVSLWTPYVVHGACLPADVTHLDDGLANCRIEETLDFGGECAGYPGRIPTADPSTCLIAEIRDPATESGWYLTTGEPCGTEERALFTLDAEPRPGTTVELRCGTISRCGP